MNIYAKRLLENLPGTLAELAERTGFQVRYLLQAVLDLRAEGHRVTAVGRPGEPTTFEGGTYE